MLEPRCSGLLRSILTTLLLQRPKQWICLLCKNETWAVRHEPQRYSFLLCSCQPLLMTKRDSIHLQALLKRHSKFEQCDNADTSRFQWLLLRRVECSLLNDQDRQSKSMERPRSTTRWTTKVPGTRIAKTSRWSPWTCIKICGVLRPKIRCDYVTHFSAGLRRFRPPGVH